MAAQRYVVSRLLRYGEVADCRRPVQKKEIRRRAVAFMLLPKCNRSTRELFKKSTIADDGAYTARWDIAHQAVGAESLLGRTAHRRLTTRWRIALSLCQVAGEQLQGRYPKRFTDLHELDDIQPSLAALELRDERLRVVEPLSQIDLSDTKLPAHSAQQVEQSPVVVVMGRSCHGLASLGNPR